MSTLKALGYYDPSLDCETVSDPLQRYAIFSSQRTGSNYLCTRIINLNDRLGIPMEYLNPAAIQAFGARLFPEGASAPGLNTYLRAVATVRTTSDGWFGTKIQPAQLLPHLNGDIARVVRFLGKFDRLIFMTRRDKLRQAISGAIATATGEWLNFGTEPRLTGVELDRLFPYIERFQQQYIDEEDLINSVSDHLRHKPTLHTVYEDILENAEAVFQRVVAFLGADIGTLHEDTNIRRPTEPPPGEMAERIRLAYLEHLGEQRSKR